jgi:hypothetical protein
VLLAIVTAALKDAELTSELWLAEKLGDKVLETLLEMTEELTKPLDNEDDPEGLVLDGKPWALLKRTVALVEEETTTV